MSKIPVEKNSHNRSTGIYYNAQSKIRKGIGGAKDIGQLKVASQAATGIMTPDDVKKQMFCSSYASLLPKMKEEMAEVTKQNPRILDLRLKLNEITQKQDRSVDKQTKCLINGITQQLVDEKEQDDSGPYSLLLDLQCNASTSYEGKKNTDHESRENPNKDEGISNIQYHAKSSDTLNRLPSVVHIDDKPMKEFEYSCETESNFPVKRTFYAQSRSDLCLNFKSYTCPRPYEPNLSPNENSLTRANDENSLDDSLGILTPDQMDDICYLENAFSPTVEGLPSFCDNNDSKGSPDTGDTPSTDKTESHSAASTIQNDGYEGNDNNGKVVPPALSCIPLVHLETAGNENQHTIIVSSNQELLNQSSVEGIKKVTDTKDDLIANIMEEEFMPSIHSSILEPASSIAETTVNLELPLDCKTNENRLTPHRVEQTPSPEDLPLDSCDMNGEISTYSNSQYSALQDTQTFSDGKTDFPKSMETSKVSNSFITSITSITSLDGYQGDGEMSRPASRGGDHSIGARDEVIEMDWQNVPVTRRVDPMTDSDFFTESDADGLDDTMQRGDRRAQVIDGALYGGKNGNGNPPLIVNRSEDSCMDSSGVYTDFETHRTSPVFLNVIDDMSPEGSTPSTHSECSQKNINTGKEFGTSPTLDDTLKSNYSTNDVNKIHIEENLKACSKRNSFDSEKDLKLSEGLPKEEKRFMLKKYKMPKRDVPSKLKSMLASRKNEGDSTQSSPKVAKKNDRRESVSKKNSNDAKNDYKAKSFKDVKSKVDCSFSLQRSQTTCSVTRMLSSKSPNVNPKPKSRHMRMRMELGSANGSGKSSLHSSQSDISASSTPLGKVPANRFPSMRNGKKRDSIPTPPTNARAPANHPQPPAATPAKKNGVVQKLAASPVAVRARTSLAPPPSPRKTAPRRAPVQRPTTLPTSTPKEPPRVSAAVGPRGKRVQTPPQSRASPAPLPPPPPPNAASKDQLAALAHAAKGVEALGVLVQYLMFRLDALNSDTWRVEAERWRGVAAAERSSAARADRDRQQRAQKDLDTIAECLSKISELEIEVSAKEEVTARLQAAHCEEVSALASDIKELKETIESLKHEAAHYAAEELRERAAARQRDAERLRDDNRRLRDAAARDRDQAARLAVLNEELRYKLRQKYQVVSLLAGGGYIDRSAMRVRTASCDSARSSSPPPDSPPSPASSPAPDSPPLPTVKGVVEKHDSVSWVLEIEETPEEVATRLARRSSFRTNAASPSGVKRRGGGSPGSGSPAPASPAPNASKLFRPGDLDFPPPPPPLKESAGEAIYIYDDRQY